jgi:putative ABC transport system permease protein
MPEKINNNKKLKVETGLKPVSMTTETGLKPVSASLEKPKTKPTKGKGYFEFIQEPSDEEVYKFVPILPGKEDTKKKVQSFVELSGGDISLVSANKKLNKFFIKKGKIKGLFLAVYKAPAFIVNKILDKGYLLIKKLIFFERKEVQKEDVIQITEDVSKAKDEYLKNNKISDVEKGFDKKEVGAQNLVPVQKGKEKKIHQKIQFKTLLLFSSRMFTSGSTRTILTILGISISIGVILFLISFGYGLQKTVLGRITTEESLKSLVVKLPENNPIKKEAIDKMKNIKEVDVVSPLVEYNGSVEVENIVIDSTIYIVDKDYFSLAGLMSFDGKNIKPETGSVAVSSSVAILLGFEKKEGIIGSKIFLKPEYLSSLASGIIDPEMLKESEKNRKEFVVRDVVEDELTAFIYVLNDEYPDLFADNFVEAKVKVKTQEDLEVVKQSLFAEGYIVSSISDTVEETRKIFRWIQLVLGFFGLVALIISAVGMLNILTIVLLERTQEIGIMKAIGASNNDVWKMVIFDAIIIGFLGGIGGSIIGLSASKFFNFIFSLLAQKIGGQAVAIFQAPPGFVMSIIMFSSVIGFLTGVWPAIRASRISPLEAIRYK